MMKKPITTAKIAGSQSSIEPAPFVNLQIAPTEKQIQQRAYELHMSRGGQGHALIDWLQAESELNANMKQLQQNNSAALKNHQFIKDKI
jgi:Protein of unknown function (DUF2934)